MQLEAEGVGSHKALFMGAWNRAGYAHQALKAVAQFEDLGSYDFYLFLDGVTDDEDREAQLAIKESAAQVPNTTVVEWPAHLGCDSSFIDARKYLFEDQGYDVVVQMDDDVVMAPYALRALEALSQRGGPCSLPTLWAWCTESVTWKQAHLGECIPTPPAQPSFIFTWFTRLAYERTRSFMALYRELYSSEWPRRRDAASIRAWYRTLGVKDPESWATGADGALAATAQHLGIPLLQPVVNHGLYIGVEGAHSDSAGTVFHRLGADRMKLDLLPQVVAALGEYR